MATAPPAPQLSDRTPQPKGVLNKNLKILLYGAFCVVLIVAMAFSAKKKTASKSAAIAPALESNTESSRAALEAQLAAEKGAVAPPTPDALPEGAAAQPIAAPAYVQPPQQAQGTTQLTPEQQEAEQLALKERERQYASRFESNLVFNGNEGRSESDSGQGTQQSQRREEDRPSNFTSEPRAAGEKHDPLEAAAEKRAPEVNIDSATGQPYVVYEGTTIDTVLMNRLDGDAVGPVKVLVSSPLYSHDHQNVLIPDGSVILGEAKKIGAKGFGQQRRIAVVFHRLIMPDGYSVDLDRFQGLDQVGQSGLKDKVNNHYLEVFGTSIALGVISGAAQITEGGSLFGAGGTQEFTTGASSGVSQQATTVLDKFIQIPPTLTIREGHRVKVYISQDLLLPAYNRHTIPQTF